MTAVMIVERLIVKRVIADLLGAYPDLDLSLNEGEEDAVASRDPIAIYEAMFKGDEDALFVGAGDAKESFVYFVYGNEGVDVIHDYAVRLMPVMDPIIEWIDRGMDL
jgi:hypothetical protein